jgi:hypothetical protein
VAEGRDDRRAGLALVLHRLRRSTAASCRARDAAINGALTTTLRPGTFATLDPANFLAP